MQVINIVKPTPIDELRLTNDVTYRPDKGWKWLQRLCLWTMRKIKAYREEHIHVGVAYARVDTQKLLESIRGQINEFLRDGYEPTLVLMGNKDYYDLMEETYTLSFSIAFTMSYDLHKRVEDRFSERGWKIVGKIMGLDVVLFPYMSGVLVIDEKMLKPRL